MYTVAVDRAKALGIKVIMPYYQYDDSDVINIVVDQTSYAQDAVKLMQSKLQALYKSSGTIIIYGDDTTGIELYESALSGVSGYTITKMSRGGKDAQTTTTELKDLMKTNRNIVAVLCVDSDGAPLWAQAASKAQAELKTQMQSATPTPTTKATPTPTPTPSPKPTPTPTPIQTPTDGSTPTPKPTATPKPWITNPVIIAMDYTKDNISVIDSDGAYALIARPYFDASAQAVTIADKLMRGLSVPSDLTEMYVPVVTKNNIAKYEDILNEVIERFGYEEIAS
jgi:ABC-type sugar transport system substrate-binding protein